MLTPISLGGVCGEKVLLGFHKCQNLDGNPRNVKTVYGR